MRVVEGQGTTVRTVTYIVPINRKTLNRGQPGRKCWKGDHVSQRLGELQYVQGTGCFGVGRSDEVSCEKHRIL